jgi:hypothetical protein
MRGIVPPASYSVPQDICATIGRVAAYMGGLAILAILAVGFLQRAAGVVAVVPPAPAWIRVERPRPAFALAMPEPPSSASDYAILRRTTDRARKDVLTWGAASASGPYVMIEIYRPSDSNERFMDAPSEIASRILAFAVTDDVKPAGRIDSKFGAVSLVDFAIAQHGSERRCLGFARTFDKPVMQIAGWYCSAGEEVVDRAALACALDRLSMLSAGGDAKLDELFARAELKRTFCGEHNPILAATPEREQPTVALQNAKLRGRLPLR